MGFLWDPKQCQESPWEFSPNNIANAKTKLWLSDFYKSLWHYLLFLDCTLSLCKWNSRYFYFVMARGAGKPIIDLTHYFLDYALYLDNKAAQFCRWYVASVARVQG